MRAGAVRLFRVLTWCCLIALAVLSLLPAIEMVRTGFGHHAEHFVAYAGTAAIAIAGYGSRRRAGWIIAGLCLYAGVLEYLQHFSPSRNPALDDFAVSSLGALCGGGVAYLCRRRIAIMDGA